MPPTVVTSRRLRVDMLANSQSENCENAATIGHKIATSARPAEQRLAGKIFSSPIALR